MYRNLCIIYKRTNMYHFLCIKNLCIKKNFELCINSQVLCIVFMYQIFSFMYHLLSFMYHLFSFMYRFVCFMYHFSICIVNDTLKNRFMYHLSSFMYQKSCSTGGVVMKMEKFNLLST